MNKSVITALITTLLVMFAGPLAAHPVHDEVATFASGLLHPFSDWGHLLSVITIGLWAGWRSRKLSAVDLLSWIVIASFLAINGYMHGTVMASLTWAYAAGMLLSTVVLLSIGVLISVEPRQESSQSISTIK
jgi:hydrogenase/urease accessory protein HupE